MTDLCAHEKLHSQISTRWLSSSSSPTSQFVLSSTLWELSQTLLLISRAGCAYQTSDLMPNPEALTSCFLCLQTSHAHTGHVLHPSQVQLDNQFSRWASHAIVTGSGGDSLIVHSITVANAFTQSHVLAFWIISDPSIFYLFSIHDHMGLIIFNCLIFGTIGAQGVFLLYVLLWC